MYNVDNELYSQVHELFLNRQYDKLYNKYPLIFNQLLSIASKSELQDFLTDSDDIDEKVFWLFYNSLTGKSLLIGGYEGDVSAKLNTYFQQNLPEMLYNKLKCCIENCYVDIDVDGDVDFEEQIMECNQMLKGTGYSVLMEFDDTYCSGVYFISILQP